MIEGICLNQGIILESLGSGCKIPTHSCFQSRCVALNCRKLNPADSRSR